MQETNSRKKACNFCSIYKLHVTNSETAKKNQPTNVAPRKKKQSATKMKSVNANNPKSRIYHLLKIIHDSNQICYKKHKNTVVVEAIREWSAKQLIVQLDWFRHLRRTKQLLDKTFATMFLLQR